VLEVDATLVATAASEVPGLISDLCPAESQFFRRTIDEPRHVVAVALSPHGIECPAITVAERGLLSAVVEITPPGTDARRLLLLGRPGTADALDDEIAERFISAALPLVGDLQPSLKEFAVVRRRVTRFDVGHYRGVARVRQEQEQRFDARRVLLCGDYLVAPHAEGAVTAGIRGAEDLLSRLSSES
jgi:hypothetical protein